MAIKLCDKAFGGNNPAAGRELLRIVALPDLDLIDFIISQSSGLHGVDETHSIVVA